MGGDYSLLLHMMVCEDQTKEHSIDITFSSTNVQHPSLPSIVLISSRPIAKGKRKASLIFSSLTKSTYAIYKKLSKCAVMSTDTKQYVELRARLVHRLPTHLAYLVQANVDNDRQKNFMNDLITSYHTIIEKTKSDVAII